MIDFMSTLFEKDNKKVVKYFNKKDIIKIVRKSIIYKL